MTFEEACRLFADYGNVASKPDILAAQRPTEGQLNSAGAAAVRRGADVAAVDEAKAAILSHWSR